jgi:hypothetical protein
MLSFTSSGSFKNTESYLAKLAKAELVSNLDKYGRMGVEALAKATPVDSGITANSWTYKIVRQGESYSIEWNNTHIVSGQNIAILIQYGHGTGTGGYIQGRDYINPAMQPVFNQIAQDVWKVVSNA